MYSFNWKLKMITIFCQAYFVLFSTLTLIILINVTIPAVCVTNEKDIGPQIESEIYTPSPSSRHKHLNFVALFVFCNTLGNYICLRCKARLSCFKCSSTVTSKAYTHKAGISHDTESIGRQIKYVNNNNDTNKPMHSDKINETNYLSIQITSDNSTNPHLTSFNNNESLKAYKAKSEKTAWRSAAEYWHQNSYFATEGTDKLCHDKNMNDFFQCSASDWHVCMDCSMTAPPRAKHCPLCGHCVLKRDHHCFFADCCVGYHNQRYFILFCLYGGLGTLLCALTMPYYLDQHYTQLKTLGYVSYLPPVILYSWIHNDSIGSFILAMLIFQYLSVATTAFCFYLCITQLYLSCKGLTAYEYKKSIHKYRGTFVKNIHSVFGRYWFVGLVVPAPCFGYVDDGIHWNNSSISKLL